MRETEVRERKWAVREREGGRDKRHERDIEVRKTEERDRQRS